MRAISRPGLRMCGARPARASRSGQFGYLADHYNAVVAKAIITTFYGTAPAYSYFDGYSDGGRAAVQEAQRYPRDFNGTSPAHPRLRSRTRWSCSTSRHSICTTPAATRSSTKPGSRRCTTPPWRPAVSMDRSTTRGCVTGTPLRSSAARGSPQTASPHSRSTAEAMYRGPVTPTGSTCGPVVNPTAPSWPGRLRRRGHIPRRGQPALPRLRQRPAA